MQHPLAKTAFLLIIYTIINLTSSVEIKATTISTKDNLHLRFNNKNGTLRELLVANNKYKTLEGGFYIQELTTEIRKRTHVKGRIKRNKEGFSFAGSVKDQNLNLTAQFASTDKAIFVSGNIYDKSLSNRCLILSFVIPYEAKGGTWWDDINNSKNINEGKFANIISFGTRGNHSPYPFCAITKKNTGLILGIPLKSPIIHRLIYSANTNSLQIEFDLGLSPYAKFKSYASFEFFISKIDEPAWGFRSAVNKYSELFPKSNVLPLRKKDSWKSFKEQASFADYATLKGPIYNANPVLPFTSQPPLSNLISIEPWSISFPLPRNDDSSFNEEASLMETPEYPGQSRLSAILLSSGTYQTKGIIPSYVSYLDFNIGIKRKPLCKFIVNPHPDLLENRTKFKEMDKRINGYLENKHSQIKIIKGVSIDSFGEWVHPQQNYRQSHWYQINSPLTFSWETKEPCQLACFNAYEYKSYIKKFLDSKDLFLMGHTLVPYFSFSYNLLDVCSQQTDWFHWDDNFKKYNYSRVLTDGNPFLLFNKYSLDDVRESVYFQTYLNLSLHYGFIPSIILPPQNYKGTEKLISNHINSKNILLGKYINLVQIINDAGWEPVTYAQTRNDAVLIERYGKFKDNNLYFTIFNKSNASRSVSLRLSDLKLKLPKISLSVMDIQRQRIIAHMRVPNLTEIKFIINPRECKVFWITDINSSLKYFLENSKVKIRDLKNILKVRNLNQEILSFLGPNNIISIEKIQSKTIINDLMQLNERLLGIKTKIGTLVLNDNELAMTIVNEILESFYQILKVKLGVEIDITLPLKPTLGDKYYLPLSIRHQVKNENAKGNISLTIIGNNNQTFSVSTANLKEIQTNKWSSALVSLEIPTHMKSETNLKLKTSLNIYFNNKPLIFNDTYSLHIAPHLEMFVHQTGSEPSFKIILLNNSNKTKKGVVNLHLPSGWTTLIKNSQVMLPARSKRILNFVLLAPENESTDYHEITFNFTLESGTKIEETCYFIYAPPLKNMIKNPGFEISKGKDLINWNIPANLKYSLEKDHKDSGKLNLCIKNSIGNNNSSVTQLINLNKKPQRPYIFSGYAKFNKFSNQPPELTNKSISLEVNYGDESTSDTFSLPFKYNEFNSAWRQTIIFPKSLIQSFVCKLSFFKQLGKVNFDDIYLSELIPGRKNQVFNSNVYVDSIGNNSELNVLKDGLIVKTEDNKLLNSTWTSNSRHVKHWVEISLDKPIEVRKIILWWPLENSTWVTSRKIKIELFKNGRWTNSKEFKLRNNFCFTVHEISAQGIKRIRIIQEVGLGHPSNPNVMKINEIEIY